MANEEQREELEALVCVFGDEVKIDGSNIEIDVGGCILYMRMPESYPEIPLQLSIGGNDSKAKQMLKELKEVAELNVGVPSVMIVIEQYQALQSQQETSTVEEEDYKSDGEVPAANHGGWIVSVSTDPCWVKIAVDVRPGRPTTAIMNPTDIRRSKAESLEMDVSAPARLGAANTELFKFLSKKLKIPRDNITFSSSRTTRSKCLTLSDILPDDIVERMNS